MQATGQISPDGMVIANLDSDDYAEDEPRDLEPGRQVEQEADHGRDPPRQRGLDLDLRENPGKEHRGEDMPQRPVRRGPGSTPRGRPDQPES